MKQVSAEVIDNREILPGVKRPDGRTMLGGRIIWLRCPEIGREARPGQFVMVRCGEDCVLPRPFSVHQVGDNGDVALFYAVWENGRGTGWLVQRRVGEVVELFGPLGNHFNITRDSSSLLLVAGGMGIAPLSFLTQEALKRKCSVTLLYGTTNEYQYPGDMFPGGIELVTTTEDGTVGQKGRVTDVLPHFIDRADCVFACGPVSMYRDMYVRREELLKAKPVQVSLEVRMGCGLGVCYGCTVKTKGGLKQVCTHGPVFDLDDVLWDEIK